MLRFDADDLGRPGAEGGTKADPECNAGVLGEDWLSGGTRFERTRRLDLLLGGDTVRSMADADRAGGGAMLELEDAMELLRPGETV